MIYAAERLHPGSGQTDGGRPRGPSWATAVSAGLLSGDEVFLQAARAPHWPGKQTCLAVGPDAPHVPLRSVGEPRRFSTCAGGTWLPL